MASYEASSDSFQKPLLIVLGVEVPLDNASIVLWFILAAVESLSVECEDHILSRTRRYLLYPEALARLVGVRLFDNDCSIFIRVVGKRQAKARLPVYQQHFKRRDVDDAELLIIAAPTIVNYQLALVVSLLAEI